MRSSVRGAASLTVLLGTGLLHAAPAPAPPPASPSPPRAKPTRLVYTRGPGAERCPDEAALRSAVQSRLGYDPFQPDATRTVTATLGARGKTLRADVGLDRAHSRHLEAALDDCNELVASVALTLAIAVDPQSQLRPPPPVVPTPCPAPPDVTPKPREPPPEPPPPLPVPLPAAVTPPPVSEPLRFQLGLAGLAAVGSAPHATFGLALAAGLRRGWLSAALEARADLPASSDAATGGVVREQLLSLTLAPCFHRSILVACALGTAGLLRGSGSGVTSPRSDATAFGAVGARLGLEVPLGRLFALTVSGDASALLPRTSLQLRGQDVWTTAPAVGTVRFGVVKTFP